MTDVEAKAEPVAETKACVAKHNKYSQDGWIALGADDSCWYGYNFKAYESINGWFSAFAFNGFMSVVVFNGFFSILCCNAFMSLLSVNSMFSVMSVVSCNLLVLLSPYNNTNDRNESTPPSMPLADVDSLPCDALSHTHRPFCFQNISNLRIPSFRSGALVDLLRYASELRRMNDSIAVVGQSNWTMEVAQRGLFKSNDFISHQFCLIQQLLRREWTGWKLFTGRDVVH
jgi:hypothetical protein